VGSGNPVSAARAIASLPAPWRAMLRDALVRLDVAAVQRVVGEIEEHSSEVPVALRNLVTDYRFGELLRIVDRLESTSPP
jgi:hypothetical protein